jgi:hypothetical protein
MFPDFRGTSRELHVILVQNPCRAFWGCSLRRGGLPQPDERNHIQTVDTP